MDGSSGAFSTDAEIALLHEEQAEGKIGALANWGRGIAVPRLIKKRLSHSTFPASTLTFPDVSTDSCGTKLKPTPSARPLPFSMAHKNEPDDQMKKKERTYTNMQSRFKVECSWLQCMTHSFRPLEACIWHGEGPAMNHSKRAQRRRGERVIEICRQETKDAQCYDAAKW